MIDAACAQKMAHFEVQVAALGGAGIAGIAEQIALKDRPRLDIWRVHHVQVECEGRPTVRFILVLYDDGIAKARKVLSVGFGHESNDFAVCGGIYGKSAAASDVDTRMGLSAFGRVLAMRVAIPNRAAFDDLLDPIEDLGIRICRHNEACQ